MTLAMATTAAVNLSLSDRPIHGGCGVRDVVQSVYAFSILFRCNEMSDISVERIEFKEVDGFLWNGFGEPGLGADLPGRGWSPAAKQRRFRGWDDLNREVEW